MMFAYADPPYIGQARKHYGPDAKEVNHAMLIAHLNTFDAWALSCSTPSLEEIMHVCREVCGPNKVRIGGWFKPFASFKPGVNPGYCWEPVIYRGGRKLGRDVPTVRDYVSANITLKRGVSGAKPEAFCHWLFEFVGLDRALICESCATLCMEIFAEQRASTVATSQPQVGEGMPEAVSPAPTSS